MDEIESYPRGCIFKFRAPLTSEFPEPLTPPFREIFQHAFHRGGVDFFWNNPMHMEAVTFYFPIVLECRLIVKQFSALFHKINQRRTFCSEK